MCRFRCGILTLLCCALLAGCALPESSLAEGDAAAVDADSADTMDANMEEEDMPDADAQMDGGDPSPDTEMDDGVLSAPDADISDADTRVSDEDADDEELWLARHPVTREVLAVEVRPDGLDELVPGAGRFREVLEGAAPFSAATTEADTGGETVYLPDYLDAKLQHRTASMDALALAVVDLDGDGAPEIVLYLPDKYTEYMQVLRWQDGEVYGYSFGRYRMYDIKTDGSYSSSGGSDIKYWYRLVFRGAEYEEIELAAQEMWKERIAGENATPEEMVAFRQRQFEKEDVAWYRLAQ